MQGTEIVYLQLPLEFSAVLHAFYFKEWLPCLGDGMAGEIVVDPCIQTESTVPLGFGRKFMLAVWQSRK